MTKTMYLVIDHDDHGDPDYHVRAEKEQAIELAETLVQRAKQHYKGMKSYPIECDGRGGFWFSESGEDRWRVSVREIEVPNVVSN